MTRQLSLAAISLTFLWGLVPGAYGQPDGDAGNTQSTSTQSAPKYLIVRYDDYAPRDTSRPGVAGIELERRLFRLIEQYDAKLVVGVIPEPVAGAIEGHEPYAGNPDWLTRPDDPWVKLLRASVASGTVIPALHGHAHQRATAPAHRPGEFVGRDYDWQLRVLTEGRTKLADVVGRSVDVFVPPWNAWDRNTALALEAAGFTWLSPDLYHARLPDGSLLVLPQTTGDPADVLELMSDPDELRQAWCAVLVTHPFDFTGERGPHYWRSLEDVLRLAQSSNAWRWDGLEAMSKSRDQRRGFRAAVAYRNAVTKLGDMIGGRALAEMPMRAIPTTPRAEAMASTARRTLSVFAAATTAVGALAGWFAARVSRRRRRGPAILAIVGALATVVLIAGAWHIVQAGYHVRGLRVQAILLWLGGTLGAAIAAYSIWRAAGTNAQGGAIEGTLEDAKRQEPR